MSILLDCRTLQTYSAYRGIGRYTRQLMRVFRDDPRCYFLFFDGPGREAGWPREVKLKSPRRLITFSDRVFLRQLITERNFQGYHSTAFALPAKPAGKKFLMTIHDLTPIRFPQYSSLRHRIIFKKIIESARNADIVLTVSKNTAVDLLNYLTLDPERVQVVHNALDDRINPDTACKPDMDLPSEYLLYTGGCDPIKNVETIVKASRLVRIPLVIAGEVDRAKQKVLRGLYGSGAETFIRFTGYVSDSELSYLYNHALLFLFPSFYEGFGYPPLEAIRCQTPPLVSKVGALIEILGDAAVYVDDPGDPAAFAEKIERIISDGGLRKDLLRKGVALLKAYSMESFAAGMKEVYSGLFPVTAE